MQNIIPSDGILPRAAEQLSRVMEFSMGTDWPL